MMKENINQIACMLRQESGLYIATGSGIFLFIHVFQPFPLGHLTSENRVLFAIGAGAIAVAIAFLIRGLYPGLPESYSPGEKESSFQFSLSLFFMWFLCSVIISFYLQFAGGVSLTLFLVFKVLLICLMPPLVFRVFDKMAGLKQQNASLRHERKVNEIKTDRNIADQLNQPVDFFSENRSEKLSLLNGTILLLKSADNYVEIHYLEEDQLQKSLIRNTLKNIELQIKAHPNFLRCHRMCIINTHHIEKLSGNCNNNELYLRGYPEQIPVSRQYFFTIREAR